MRLRRRRGVRVLDTWISLAEAKKEHGNVRVSEQETRRDLIDIVLGHSQWEPIIPHCGQPPSALAVVTEYPTDNGPADYVLFHNGEPLAIVEAKRRSTGAQNVLHQAKRYAAGLKDSPFNFFGCGVPFIYSSDGDNIWFRDLRDPLNRSRQVRRFHTPNALREMLQRNTAAAVNELLSSPVAHPLLRPYQREAIQSAEVALNQGKRKLLVSMATGTGKTLTAIALLYRLVKSGFARRVLFLVDRRALAAQAVLAFSQFEAEPGLKFDRVYEVYSQRFHRGDIEEQRFDPKVLPTSYLTNPDLKHAFVYVSTIQRMAINLFGLPEGTRWKSDQDDESDAAALNIPIHAFDVIIADECHRGYTASEQGRWRETLDHFDGIKVGLTATPAAHTVSYFGNIVYRYEYERAVREGYLVDYDAITIQSRVTMQGAFLQPGEIVALQDRQTGRIRYEELEDERPLLAPELEQEWAAPDRDRKIVQELAQYLQEQEEEKGRFPKTLVFADNDLPHTSHADRLVDLLRDEFGRGDDFVQKITGSPTVDRPLQRIREFRNRPEPAIVVTVDMLSTGVDIPALENIVFLRPVRSRILFEQMMGRGTRLCPEINKTNFTVFDAVGALSYFEKASAFTVDPPAKPSVSAAQVIEAIYNNEDREYSIRRLVKRLLRIEKHVSGEGRELFARFIPDSDIASFANSLPERLQTDWATTMRILRDPAFQDLLENYPRAHSPFIVAESVEDEVVSGYLIHTANGRMVRPDDYLIAFERFVRDNPEHIEAIRILLDRPSDWGTEALHQLRNKLASRPEGFTEPRLRQAYGHELADIISIVKHAAKGEPLLSAGDRVSRAIASVRADKTFTPEQERWLNLIANHLVENLAIEQEDFNLITFSREGASWGRVNRDFDGGLEALLAEINAAMAS